MPYGNAEQSAIRTAHPNLSDLPEPIEQEVFVIADSGVEPPVRPNGRGYTRAKKKG